MSGICFASGTGSEANRSERKSPTSLTCAKEVIKLLFSSCFIHGVINNTSFFPEVKVETFKYQNHSFNKFSFEDVDCSVNT